MLTTKSFTTVLRLNLATKLTGRGQTEHSPQHVWQNLSRRSCRFSRGL